jgi:hypothetical protein
MKMEAVCFTETLVPLCRKAPKQTSVLDFTRLLNVCQMAHTSPVAHTAVSQHVGKCNNVYKQLSLLRTVQRTNNTEACLCIAIYYSIVYKTMSYPTLKVIVAYFKEYRRDFRDGLKCSCTHAFS